jgi:hypothetical protein
VTKNKSDKEKKSSGGRPTNAHSQQRTNILVENGKLSFKTKRSFVLWDAKDLTEAEWQAIATSSPLPPNARMRIAAAIAEYRNCVSASRTSPKTKRLIDSMRGHIKKLLANAAKLENDPVFFNVGLIAILSRSGPVPGDVSKLISGVPLLDQVLADAQDRMRKVGRGRKPLEPLKRLIMRLVWINAEATGRYVKRSIKTGMSTRPLNRFVQLSVRAADPKIPVSMIENALTQCISEHHKIREEYGFDTATGRRVKIRQKRVELPRTLSR